MIKTMALRALFAGAGVAAAGAMGMAVAHADDEGVVNDAAFVADVAPAPEAPAADPQPEPVAYEAPAEPVQAELVADVAPAGDGAPAPAPAVPDTQVANLGAAAHITEGGTVQEWTVG